jgi:hypothetical protein
MIYDPRVIRHTTAVAAKLLGAYERELQPAIERLLTLDVATFVDIGSAEGYYVTGISLRRPDVEVIAFDVDPAARAMCRIIGHANRLKVDIRPAATTDYLATLSDRCVLLSDCEGAERELLNPSAVPSLRRVPILVEVHDFVHSGLTQTLCDRFTGSHVIQQIATQPRDSEDYPELSHLSPADRDLALNEGRPEPMVWLLMIPRTAPA